LDLKDESVRDDITSGGRLFRVLAAAMGNAWSLMYYVTYLYYYTLTHLFKMAAQIMLDIKTHRNIKTDKTRVDFSFR